MQTWHDLIKWRSLIVSLALTNLKVRYKGTIIGVFWSFLEPLLLLSVFYVVFSSIFGSSIPHYPLYIFTGLMMFYMFVRATTMGLSSISNYSSAVGNSKIPLFVFPIAANLTALIMMLIDLSIFFIYMAITGFWPPITILLLPVSFGLLLILTIGISLPLSVLGIRFKDLHYIWTLLTSTLLFVTPIFYKLENMPQNFQQAVLLSPWTRLVKMTQDFTLYGKTNSFDWAYVVSSIFIILVIGFLIFKKQEKNIVQSL